MKTRNKGIYQDLFCSGCEAILQKYETHAAKVLFSDGKHKLEVTKTPSALYFNNINYTLFKLFQISLFWRSSLSIRPEIPAIELEQNTEILRKMLYEEKPGKSNEYGSIVFYSPNFTRKMFDSILPPQQLKEKISGNICYRAIFNGLIFLFICTNELKDNELSKYLLQENGTLPLVSTGPGGDRFILEIMRDFFKDLK